MRVRRFVACLCLRVVALQQHKLRLLQRLPLLRRLPARLVGIGVRPERVRTPPFPPAA